MSLRNFHRGTTKRFQVEITVDDVAPDITNDTVLFTAKLDPDLVDAKGLQSTADVATQGADGIAIVTLSKTDTDIVPGLYYYDIQWQLIGGDELVVAEGKVKILPRVSDV